MDRGLPHIRVQQLRIQLRLLQWGLGVGKVTAGAGDRVKGIHDQRRWKRQVGHGRAQWRYAAADSN